MIIFFASVIFFEASSLIINKSSFLEGISKNIDYSIPFFKESTGYNNPVEMIADSLVSIKALGLSSVFALGFMEWTFFLFEDVKIFFEKNMYSSVSGIIVLTVLFIVNFALATYFNIYIQKIDKGLDYKKAMNGLFKFLVQLTLVFISFNIVKEYKSVLGFNVNIPIPEFLMLNFMNHRFLKCAFYSFKLDIINEQTYKTAKSLLSLDFIINKLNKNK